MKVHICENDRYGTKSGKAQEIIFFDAHGDSMLHLEALSMQGEPLRTTDLHYQHIICHGCYFKHNGFQGWAGNMMWNAYDVPDDHALGLINILHLSRRWALSEAWIEIARAWQENGELTGDLFELHGVQPARVNPSQTGMKFPKSA